MPGHPLSVSDEIAQRPLMALAAYAKGAPREGRPSLANPHRFGKAMLGDDYSSAGFRGSSFSPRKNTRKDSPTTPRAMPNSMGVGQYTSP